MFRSEEEKRNIVLGDALLSLLEEDADISAEALSARLKRMLDAETDDARRQFISGALRETERLFRYAGCPDDGIADEQRSAGVLSWPARKH